MFGKKQKEPSFAKEYKQSLEELSKIKDPRSYILLVEAREEAKNNKVSGLNSVAGSKGHLVNLLVNLNKDVRDMFVFEMIKEKTDEMIHSDAKLSDLLDMVKLATKFMPQGMSVGVEVVKKGDKNGKAKASRKG